MKNWICVNCKQVINYKPLECPTCGRTTIHRTDEEVKPNISFEMAKSTVAFKYGLGKTLVTGHLSKYWEEAANIFADQFRKK